jgi:hypothetical protein
MRQTNDATDYLAIMFVLLIGVLALSKAIELSTGVQERRNQAIQRLK